MRSRCYSLSDQPDPAHYRVTIERAPAPADHLEFEPGRPSNHFHDQVQVGDVLRVKAPDVTAVEGRFQRSGRTLNWDGRDASLLEFAQRQGVAVVSGCRSGGCGNCETRLLEGSAQYEHAPDHGVAAGHRPL